MKKMQNQKLNQIYIILNGFWSFLENHEDWLEDTSYKLHFKQKQEAYDQGI